MGALAAAPLLLLSLRPAACWSDVSFTSPTHDTHGPCPAKVGLISYAGDDCSKTDKGEDGHGLFRAAQCASSLGRVSLQGFAQCLSHDIKCWQTSGTAFAKLPSECNLGNVVVTSHAVVDSADPKVECPGSPINIAADGTLSLQIAQPVGCWNVKLDGVAYKPNGLSFLLVFSLCSAVYVGGGIVFAVRARGAALSLRSHPHAACWEELRALVFDGLAFAQRGGNKGNTTTNLYVPVGEQRASGRRRDDEPPEMRPRPKKEQNEKKEKAEKAGKKEQKEKKERAEREEPRVDEVATAVVAPATGTQAGDGGRWVHISN